MPIRVVARERLKPECTEEALKLIEEMVRCTTQKDEGCISYAYCRDVNAPEYFAMMECWESEEAIQKHLKSEHFTRIFPQLQGMTSEPARLEMYKELF